MAKGRNGAIGTGATAAHAAENASARARAASDTAKARGDAKSERRAADKHAAASVAYIGSDHPKAQDRIREHALAEKGHKDRAKELAKAPVQKWAESKGAKAPSFAHAMDAVRAASDATSDANVRGDATSHHTAADAHEKAAKIIKARGGDHQTHADQAAAHREKAARVGGVHGDDRPRDDHGRFASK